MYGHCCPISCLDLSADGRVLASLSSPDGSVYVWDTQTTEKLLDLQGHRTPVNCLCLSADGTLLCLAFEDKTVQVFEHAGFKQMCQLRGHAGTVLSLAMSADGKCLAVGSKDGACTMWDWQAAGKLEAGGGVTAGGQRRGGAPVQ